MSSTCTLRRSRPSRRPLQITINTKVRLLVRRAYGFHSATAALALVMLACGPITLTLPHEQQADQAAA
jgi:hypothetical protein